MSDALILESLQRLEQRLEVLSGALSMARAGLDATLDRNVSIREMVRLTGLSQSAIYARSLDPADDFPAAFAIGPRRQAWSLVEVLRWIHSRRQPA